MSLVERRAFYRLRNTFYGWMKLALVVGVIGFLGLRIMAHVLGR